MKAYTAAVMDMDRFRKVLCENREKIAGSQADLSALTKTDANPVPINAMTISAIERGAQANPSLHTVVRLVEAMRLTLSSFFAQIEGLSGEDVAVQDQAPPPAPVSPADETLSPLTAEEVHTIRALTKIIRADADREHAATEGQRRANRRHAANARRPQATPPVQTGSDRPRNARRRRVRKKPKQAR